MIESRVQTNDRACLLLVNLGSPDAPEPKAVRRYLRHFLSDRRVVEMSPLLWRPILEGIILPVRAKQSAHKYKMVWGEREAPLVESTEAQTLFLNDAFEGQVDVRYAMRYGSRSIPRALEQIYREGFRKLAVFPLYPQYSASSLGTVADEVFRWGITSRDQFDLRITRSFPTDPGYIDALALAVEKEWDRLGKPNFAGGDRLLLSYHGIPQAMADKGDPYPDECQRTTEALLDRLGLEADSILHCYQSKFGPAPWLTPATIDTVGALPGVGTKRVDVLCPGFVSDCLETLEEIEMLNREAFMAGGGAEFNYIPWGNAKSPWLEALFSLSRTAVDGW